MRLAGAQLEVADKIRMLTRENQVTLSQITKQVLKDTREKHRTRLEQGSPNSAV